MKTLIKWLSWAGYIGLAIASILLMLSPYVDVIGRNIAIHTWIGIFCGILATFVIRFSELAIKTVEKNLEFEVKLIELNQQFQSLIKIRGQVKHLSLAEAIKFTTVESKHFSKVRIYASTTAVILQIIRDLKLQIDECLVMIQIFAEDDVNPNSIKLNLRCIDMVEGWNELKDNGNIRNLKVVRYNRYPSEYVLIFDEKFLIQGKYGPTSTSPHGSIYYDPILVDNEEVATKVLVDEQIKWFDLTFEYFNKHVKQDKYKS